ncbi:MAG: hypothetical protein DLM59_08825 [Pseudonocardiales bacterium]|nr:MAG: hypothetical protein DLM59_08825 [Pseudonocardiales bacterium]
MKDMTTFTLTDVERAFRASWSLETTSLDEVGRSRWDPLRPAVGQCGPTALVVQDLLGGELLFADLTGGGEEDEHHYWIRFVGGVEVDLTCEQIGLGRTVSPPKVVVRPPDFPHHKGPRAHVAAYLLLRARVADQLGLSLP